MKTLVKITVGLALAGVLSTTTARAQTRLAGWNGYNSATTTFPLAASSLVSSLASATLNYNQLFTINDGRGLWSATNTASVLNTTTAPYLDWSITIKPGNAITNATFFFNLAKLDSQTQLQLSYSLDNYSSSLGDLSSVTSSYQNYMFSLGTNLLSGTVDFRLYFYNVSSVYAPHPEYGNVFDVPTSSGYTTYGGTYNANMSGYSAGLLGNVQAAPVPEPASGVLAGLGIASYLIFSRRRA
jgi:hypothetical protein